MLDVTITTAEIRESWRAIQDGKNPTEQATIRNSMPRWQGSVGDSWQGCSGEEMNTWLNEGYSPEGDSLDFSPLGGEDISTAQMIFDEEEGDLMIDAVLSGEDEYRVRWDDSPAPRSIAITAQINMLASTPANVLAEYCDFVLRAVEAAMEQGGAPSLKVTHRVRNVFKQNASLLTLTIPLVEAGETVDPVSWRAFVSKASFRTLGFLARGIAADKLGYTLTTGYGSSAGIGWNVKRDGDSISITCPPSASSFPVEMMEAKLREAFEQE